MNNEFDAHIIGGGHSGTSVAIMFSCCIRCDRTKANRHKFTGLIAGNVIDGLLKEQRGGVKAALQCDGRVGAWLGLANSIWQSEQVRRYAAGPAHVVMRPMFAKSKLALLQRWPWLLTLGAGWGGRARCAADSAEIAIQNAL